MGQESLDIIVSNGDVPFVEDYEDKIKEKRKEYEKWALDNLGYVPESEHSYICYEDRVYFRFILRSEDDFAAFKLRWL